MILSRCGAFSTIPRIDGVSGRSTTWLSFVSPRLRTNCLWPLFAPIVDRYH